MLMLLTNFTEKQKERKDHIVRMQSYNAASSAVLQTGALKKG